MRRKRTQGGQRDLVACGVDARGRAGNEVLLERRAGCVIALAWHCGFDHPRRALAIGRQPNRQQRVERLQHDDQITWTQLRADERGDRRLCRGEAVVGAQVIFIDVDGDEPARHRRSRRLLVIRRHLGKWRGLVRHLNETSREDRQRLACLADREVRAGQRGGALQAVVDDDVERDRLRLSRVLRAQFGSRQDEQDRERQAHGLSP